jgi:agmatine deiminase
LVVRALAVEETPAIVDRPSRRLRSGRIPKPDTAMSPPAARGFYMPPEWAPHRRCWMAWPSREDLWARVGPRALDAACRAHATVAQAIARFEPVTMVANPADTADVSLACGTGVDVLSLPIDDSWMRDYGPCFLVDGKGGLEVLRWRFNGYGGRYAPIDNDLALAPAIAERCGALFTEGPIVAEGGAIHVDGEGTALVTEECLLNPNRNPGATKQTVEAALRDHLGVDVVIWLGRGLVDDETDGHVDEVACFAGPGRVLALACADTGDPNHERLADNLARLRGAVDAAGRPLEVIELPQPPRRLAPDGTRLALSYVNFYLAGDGARKGLVMPAFEVSEDDRAWRILRDAFPDRRIEMIPALDIVVGGGGIHCITQQEPAV